MKLMFLNEYLESDRDNTIEVNRMNVRQEDIINAFKSVKSNGHLLLDYLKKINNNITKLDIKNLTYDTKDSEMIPIDSLCTGEIIFLLAGISKITGVNISYINCMRELSESNLKTFVRTFSNDNINIVFYDSLELEYIRVENAIKELD